jgi:hypothetical protein
MKCFEYCWQSHFFMVAENVRRIQSYWNNHACCWNEGVGVDMCRLCTLCGANWNGLRRVNMLHPWVRNVSPALVAVSLNDGWRVKSFCEERSSGLYIIYDLKKKNLIYCENDVPDFPVISLEDALQLMLTNQTYLCFWRQNRIVIFKCVLVDLRHSAWNMEKSISRKLQVPSILDNRSHTVNLYVY